jgi:predicted NAD/FAD-dependent oxidoreductase
VELEIVEGDRAAGTVSARGLLLGCPVPQSLDLLAPARSGLLPEALAALAGVAYDPCFALVLVLDGPSLVPPPGGIQFAAGPLSWVADNRLKGISAVPALTVHAAGDWSRTRFDDDQIAVADELERLAARWIGPARVVERSLARWKFATPVTVLPEALVACSSAPPVACCGDAFAGPRVEGAATSGRAAGRWMAAALADRGKSHP